MFLNRGSQGLHGNSVLHGFIFIGLWLFPHIGFTLPNRTARIILFSPQVTYLLQCLTQCWGHLSCWAKKIGGGGATPRAYRSSLARDWTRTTAVTRATAVNARSLTYWSTRELLGKTFNSTYNQSTRNRTYPSELRLAKGVKVRVR